jgi:hypothetical protein
MASLALCWPGFGGDAWGARLNGTATPRYTSCAALHLGGRVSLHVLLLGCSSSFTSWAGLQRLEFLSDTAATFIKQRVAAGQHEALVAAAAAWPVQLP